MFQMPCSARRPDRTSLLLQILDKDCKDYSSLHDRMTKAVQWRLFSIDHRVMHLNCTTPPRWTKQRCLKRLWKLQSKAVSLVTVPPIRETPAVLGPASYVTPHPRDVGLPIATGIVSVTYCPLQLQRNDSSKHRLKTIPTCKHIFLYDS